MPPLLICLVPRERADALLDPLRAHFADDPRVAVLVERRAPGTGRRVDGDPDHHRRALVVDRDLARALPPELQPEADQLEFVQRLEPVRSTYQDTATAEMVQHIHRGDGDAVSELWWRCSARVRDRLRGHTGQATGDDATGLRLLGRILDELDACQPAQGSLGAWLDRVVDGYLAGDPQ
jgi:hypothetical protein